MYFLFIYYRISAGLCVRHFHFFSFRYTLIVWKQKTDGQMSRVPWVHTSCCIPETLVYYTRLSGGPFLANVVKRGVSSINLMSIMFPHLFNISALWHIDIILIPSIYRSFSRLLSCFSQWPEKKLFLVIRRVHNRKHLFHGKFTDNIMPFIKGVDLSGF